MIPGADLEALKSFESNGHLVLSVYLGPTEIQSRETAYQNFVREVERQLAGCNARPECRAAIQEDIEIVGLYLKANGHRHNAGLAIFSCAANFFWRAYPLPVAIPARISAGRRFDLEPLLDAHPSRVVRPETAGRPLAGDKT